MPSISLLSFKKRQTYRLEGQGAQHARERSHIWHSGHEDLSDVFSISFRRAVCPLTAHVSWRSCRHGETRPAGLACSCRDKGCRGLCFLLLVCFDTLEASESDRKRQCDSSRNQSRAPPCDTRSSRRVQKASGAETRVSSLLQTSTDHRLTNGKPNPDIKALA